LNNGRRRRRSRNRSTASPSLPVLLAAIFSATAQAQSTVFDEEPNDTPQQATAFSGAAVLSGSMDGSDQDGFRWTVSDEDAGHRWTLKLDGIPGRVTAVEIVRIDYDDNNDVAATEVLLRIGTRDGTLPATSPELIFEPGEYLLGIAQAGGGAAYRPPAAAASFLAEADGPGSQATNAPGGYRLQLIEGQVLPANSEEFAADQDSATAVRPGVVISTFVANSAGAWYRLQIPERDASYRWNVAAQVPVGRNAQAILTSASGERLSEGATDNRGMLVFSELALTAGDYFLQVTPNIPEDSAAGFLQFVHVSEDGQRVAGSEAEPNGYWTQANRIDSEACCSGRLGDPGDNDLFRFTVGADATDTTRTILLESASDSSFRLCLLDRTGIEIQCRSATGRIELGNLLLAPDTYGISIGYGAQDSAYRLTLTAGAAPVAGQETEPNDRFDYATGTPENNRIRGSFDGAGDIDFYRFVITDEAQLWRFQVIGDNLQRVYYHDSSGSPAQTLIVGPGERRARLENLFLLPGEHRISIVGGGAGDYTLLARSLGPPDPNSEREPNDDDTRMQPLRFGQTRTGLLVEDDDIDKYRFHLSDYDQAAAR
jgi:hypothetical protein